MSQHWADETQIITHYIEECILKDNTDATVGTISIDALHIINMKTGKATVAGQFIINFYSGETIEGTFTSKVAYFTPQPPDVDGKFVGHGDMHVKGVIYDIPESPTDFILDGYSW